MAKAKPVKDTGPFLRHKATGKRVEFVQWLSHSLLEFRIRYSGAIYKGGVKLFEASRDEKTWSTDLVEECFPYPKQFPEPTTATAKVARSA